LYFLGVKNGLYDGLYDILDYCFCILFRNEKEFKKIKKYE